MRTRDTDVEVFDGEVESLTTASVEGVGIRVDRRPTPGSRVGRFARRRRHRRDARRKRATTPASVSPTSGTGSRRRPTSNGAAPPAPRPVARGARRRCRPRRRCASRSTSSARRRRPTRASATSSRRATATRSPSRRSRTRSASRSHTRRTTCSASAVALADDGSGTQSGYGFVAGRTLVRSRSRLDPARRGDARVPAARRQARCRAGASR